MNPNLPTGKTFSEGSDMPEMPQDPMLSMMDSNEQCVPVAALQQPDDSEQLVTPEVGDAVSYTVEGKVSRIEGDKAYVTVETANGKPIADEKENEPNADDGYAALQQEAEGMMI
jgi:hypothetical protein